MVLRQHGMVPQQHDPMVVEEMVVALRRRHGSGRRRTHWRTRRWVEVTKPIPQVKRETLADELVDDGGDVTLWMQKTTEMEGAFAKDGSLPDPACQAQVKGLNIKWEGTEQTQRLVSRRLALRRSSKRETTRRTFMEVQLRNLQKTHRIGQLGTVLPISDKSGSARVPVVLMNSTVKPDNLQIIPVGPRSITKEGTATVFEVKALRPRTNESDQLMNRGGDATFSTHKGTELEADWAKDGSLPDPPNTTNTEKKCIWQLNEEMARKAS